MKKKLALLALVVLGLQASCFAEEKAPRDHRLTQAKAENEKPKQESEKDTISEAYSEPEVRLEGAMRVYGETKPRRKHGMMRAF